MPILGQLSGRSALILRNLYETLFVARGATPGSKWPHPYASVDFWDRAFVQSKARDGKTHDWLLEYPEIREWQSVKVSRFVVPDASQERALSSSSSSWWQWLGARSERHTLADVVATALSEGGAVMSDEDEVSPKASARLLITGCGSSPLAEDLYDDGWRGGSICSIDFSSEAIAAARLRAARRGFAADPSSRSSEAALGHGLQFAVADATALRVDARGPPDGGEEEAPQWQPTMPFHAVLDKGLFDALLLARPDEAAGSADRLARLSASMHRVLCPHGVWLIYSLSGPSIVKRALSFPMEDGSDDESQWVVDVHWMSKAFLYVASRRCRGGGGGDNEPGKNGMGIEEEE